MNFGPGEDDASLISVPMDCMKDIVKSVSLLDKLGGPDVWKHLNTYKVGSCTAFRIENGQSITF